MEEQREESEVVGDCREPMEEAGKELSLSSKTETLDGEVDIPPKDPCVEDANTVENSNSNVSGTNANSNDGGSATEDGSLKPGDGNMGHLVSDEKEEKADVASVEERVGSVSTEVEDKDNVEKEEKADVASVEEMVGSVSTEVEDKDNVEKEEKADVASVEEMVGSVSTEVEDKDNVEKEEKADVASVEEMVGSVSTEVEDKDNVEKEEKADVASVEEMVGSVSTEVEAKDNVDKTSSSDDVERTDAITEPETETSNVECEGDAGIAEVMPVDETESSKLRNDVQGVCKTVKSGEVETKGEVAMPEIERKDGASHESAEEKENETSAVNDVAEEKAICEVEDSSGACDADQNVETKSPQPSSVEVEMLSIAEIKDNQEKESTKKSKEDSNEMGVDNEQANEEKVSASYNEQGNSGCETLDADQEKESVKKSEEENNKMNVDSEQEKNKEVGLSYNERGNSGCETLDADQEKESAKKSEDENNKMNVDSEQEMNKEVGLSYNEHGNSGCRTSDADQEKESAKKSQEYNEKMDVDSKQASEENVGLNEQGNPGSETADAKHTESAKVPGESTQLIKEETDKGSPGTVSEVSSAAEISREEEIANVNQKEENGEAMEIDYTAEEQVETDVTVGGVLENAAAASMVQTQDVPIAAADRNDSNVVKEMEIDERKDNNDMATHLTGTIESADSANPNSPTEEAATGEVEPLDHNALFDPTSDITNFIDFSGVSSWSGNIQDLKNETGNVSLKEDKKGTDMAEEVAREDCKDTLKSADATVNAESRDKLSSSAEGIEIESNEAHVAFGAESPADATDCPKEASDAIMGSEEKQDDRDHQCLDKETVDRQDTTREEDDSTHEAPSIDPNQKEDIEMEENPNSSDYADDGTDSDKKINGVKRKADVLSEDSPVEGRKTVSFAKVSFAERPTFKIGAGIARAASQMAGSPSVLKGCNFGDETLAVESFVSQLHWAATDPVKENVVSEIATRFFLDFRNSSVSQEVAPEKVSSKRGRPSNSNAGGTEAFEFEEMGDTYWTDRVIHNGGEEQTPPTEKGNYQVVPVELKPAQVQRTRRPYRRRQSQISIPPHSSSEKPANFDENAPAELIVNFSETDTIPSEKSLSKMFRHFGPIRESQTEVDRENNRARVVYKKGADAEVAYNSAGRFNIFGTKTVNYELSHTITETFKVKPYVVSLGEEDAALGHPS